MQSNPYELLGLQVGATPSAIKSAYRARLRQVHPDLNPGDPQARVKTQELIEAYEVLSDSEKRAKIDKELRPPPAVERLPPQRHTPKQSKPSKSQRSQNTVFVHGGSVSVSQSTVVINGQVFTQTSSQNAADDPIGDATVGNGVEAGLVMGDLHIRRDSTLTLSGKVMGDVFAVGNCQITITGKVLGDVHASGSSVRVLGMVLGDLFVDRTRLEVLGVHLGDVR